MRRITLEQIRANLRNRRHQSVFTTKNFRSKTEQSGWVMKRTRPRSPDEIKALNYIARRALKSAIKEGSVRYDKETRVMELVNPRRS